MEFSYPPAFARFYDTIYHHMRDEADSGFFQDEIVRSGGKSLEIGAGTGRLFMNSFNRGADIYGLDISPAMISILIEKLPPAERFRISRQDIRDFSYPFRFSLAVAPFRVFMHLLEKDDQLKALNNVYDHLETGGRFIFDVFIPDLRQIVEGLKDHMDFEGEYAPGLILRRFVSTTPDLISQTIMVDFHLEWQEEGRTNSDNWSIPMRFFFRYELEHLIERSKFETYNIFGDYKNGPLKNGSREFVVVCQKN